MMIDRNGCLLIAGIIIGGGFVAYCIVSTVAGWLL